VGEADDGRGAVEMVPREPDSLAEARGRLLGIGMSIAIACAIVPLFFGAAPLTSEVFEADLPLVGHVEFVTSTLFDVGVYLVVIGLVLDVLRRRGVEIRALLAEDGRLEDLYRELVADYGEDVQPGGDRASATSARSAEEGS